MKQIRIVTTDRPGLLAEITDAMAAAGVNIEDLAAESIGSFAAIEMTVDRYDDALKVLARTPFRAITEDILILRLPDKPGALAGIAKRFKDAGINLRSARTLHRAGGDCVVAIDAERTEEAKALVRDVMM